MWLQMTREQLINKNYGRLDTMIIFNTSTFDSKKIQQNWKLETDNAKGSFRKATNITIERVSAASKGHRDSWFKY